MGKSLSDWFVLLHSQMLVALQELTDESSGIGQTRADIRPSGFPCHPGLKYLTLVLDPRRRFDVECRHVKIETQSDISCDGI